MAQAWDRSLTGEPVLRGIGVVRALALSSRSQPRHEETLLATDGQSWEESLISDLRAHGGRASWGPLAGRPLLVLYSIGVKSGVRRRSILTFTRDGADYVVAGTNNGAAENPHWLSNIHADPNVTFEVGSETFEAVATESAGTERNRLWENHVRELPWFAEYQELATARSIPVVRLTPKPTAG